MDFVIAYWYLFAALALILYFLAADIIRDRTRGVRSIRPEDAVLLINREGGVVLDINDAQTHRAGHIPGAMHVPFEELIKNPTQLDKHKSKPIIVSATHTKRSGEIADLLRNQGHAAVYVLTGGEIAWQRENLPLER